MNAKESYIYIDSLMELIKNLLSQCTSAHIAGKNRIANCYFRI